MHPEECLICKAPLEYLVRDEDMECAICHKKESSKTRCVNGHYVCNDCHTQGMDTIFGLCLAETSADPAAILRRMMDLSFCHMHGPEHHVMVGAALLTAYKNAGGKLDLESALREMYSRGKAVPGGACGFWGACGAGISAGQFLAIATASTPLAREPWGLSNQMTARALDSIGKVGGPRCCKRDSWLAVQAAVDFVREHLGVEMQHSVPVCSYSARNSQCIGKRCPFSAAKQRALEAKSPEFLKGQKLRDILVFPENLLHRGPLGSSSTSLPRYRISRISRSHTRTPQTLSVMRARSGFMAGAR